MKKIACFILLSSYLLVLTSLQAQNLSVKGTVRDAKTGEVLPMVNVGLMRVADTVFVRGAATEFDGAFHIKDVKPGKYLLQASFVGYEKYLKELEVRGNLDKLEISLKGGTTLGEVKIVAEKPLYVMDGEKNMYNTKEDVSIQTGTASDALQNAPGVEVDAEGNITLRGVSSVEIWVNDRPSHMNEEALKQYIKQMPANAIERIEVITNPSARYSTTGGVINIVTNQKITRNELLCVGVRARTSPSVSPWMSYVWANEKVDVNLYLNADYSHHRMEGDGTNTLFTDNGDTSRFQSSNRKTEANNLGGYTGLNLNWNITDKTHLSTWMGVYPYSIASISPRCATWATITRWTTAMASAGAAMQVLGWSIALTPRGASSPSASMATHGATVARAARPLLITTPHATPLCAAQKIEVAIRRAACRWTIPTR